MPTPPTPEADPSKPISSATQVLRTRADDAGFEADFAALAARFAAQSGGGLSPELSADLALEIVLNEIVEQACLSTGATGAAIALHRDGELVCRASSGSTAPELGARLDSASGLSGECIRTLRTQQCDDVLADPRVDVAASQRLGVRSIMVMPLLREGELAGVFELFSSLPSAFGERDERTLEALAVRVLSHLALSSAEQTRQPPPPLPEKESQQVAVAEPALVSEPLASSEIVAPGAIPEFVGEIPHHPPQPGFDFVTTFLGAAVLVCAVLLGVLLGRHFVFQNAAVRAHRAMPIANSNSAVPAPEPIAPSTAIPMNSAAPAPPVRIESDAIPPGSLRVLDNGKEVFRQSAPSGAAPNRTASSSPEQGSGMQQAASVVRENASDVAPAAENSVLYRAEPDYPESAREKQIQGPVVLDVHIGQDGLVQQMTLVSGQPLLAQAAKDAVRQWRFKPRVVDGRPATMQTRITLNFRLP
jgi:TonB family protein